MLGHDLSSLLEQEAAGNVFSDAGRVMPVERIVAAHGATHVRLRLWVDPPVPYNDLPHLLLMARRVRAAGLHLLLDLHYSDFWADPARQITPRAWQGQDLTTLAGTVHDYTRSVLAALARQGTSPAMVQIGNEVTAGMLWPLGKIDGDPSASWAGFITLLQAGIAGVLAGSPPGHLPEIMLHIDRGGDNGGSRWFFDRILQHDVPFDVIGLSYYPFWHGSLQDLEHNLHDLAQRYGKDIVLAETAYPWTLEDGDGCPNIVGPETNLNAPYPATPVGQLAFVRHLLSLLRQTPGGHGRGLVYWEPAWTPGVGWKPGAGNVWDNMTLFDFSGRSLPSIALFEGT